MPQVPMPALPAGGTGIPWLDNLLQQAMLTPPGPMGVGGPARAFLDPELQGIFRNISQLNPLMAGGVTRPVGVMADALKFLRPGFQSMLGRSGVNPETLAANMTGAMRGQGFAKDILPFSGAQDLFKVGMNERALLAALLSGVVP